MMIYSVPYAPIPDRAAMEVLMPPARRARYQGDSPGPLFAYALLAWALERHCAILAREAVAYTDAGKPYLPGSPWYFSLSHSKTHALCVLSDQAVGCDIETHRPVSEGVQRRVLGEGDATADFFARWTLRESYFKLTGCAQGQARSAYEWLCREIPGCTAAVVAYDPFPLPMLEILPPETLFSYAAEKWA